MTTETLTDDERKRLGNWGISGPEGAKVLRIIVAHEARCAELETQSKAHELSALSWKERCAELEPFVKGLRIECSNRDSRCAELERERDGLNTALDTAEERHVETAAQVALARAEMERLRAVCDSTSRLNADVCKRAQAAERERDEARAEVERLREIERLHVHSVGFWEPKLEQMRSRLATATDLLKEPRWRLWHAGAWVEWEGRVQTFLANQPAAPECGKCRMLGAIGPCDECHRKGQPAAPVTAAELESALSRGREDMRKMTEVRGEPAAPTYQQQRAEEAACAASDALLATPAAPTRYGIFSVRHGGRSQNYPKEYTSRESAEADIGSDLTGEMARLHRAAWEIRALDVAPTRTEDESELVQLRARCGELNESLAQADRINGREIKARAAAEQKLAAAERQLDFMRMAQGRRSAISDGQ